MSEPRIIKMLDASANHLPKAVDEDLNGYDGVRADRRRYGWLLWVPSDPAKYAQDYADIPASVLNLQLFARGLGCDYVLLDADADVVDGLPHWDW